MTRMVQCRKHHKQLPGLARAPFPGAGRRQAVRQQVLILPCVGSNPAAPAIIKFLASILAGFFLP